jgi:hypothetical protein
MILTSIQKKNAQNRPIIIIINNFERSEAVHSSSAELSSGAADR